MSPFKSLKQQKYLFIHHPKLAKKWVKKYGTYKKALKKAMKTNY